MIRRPSHYEWDALAAELRRHGDTAAGLLAFVRCVGCVIAGLPGFEPGYPWIRTRWVYQFPYKPMLFISVGEAGVEPASHQV
jgi:hypothetical protein